MTELIKPADWGESEWAEDGMTADEGGVLAEVFPSDFEPGAWGWTVKATCDVSEWPEAYDAGVADSKELALLEAEKALWAAVAHYAPALARKQAEREAERAELAWEARRDA